MQHKLKHRIDQSYLNKLYAVIVQKAVLGNGQVLKAGQAVGLRAAQVADVDGVGVTRFHLCVFET